MVQWSGLVEHDGEEEGAHTGATSAISRLNVTSTSAYCTLGSARMTESVTQRSYQSVRGLDSLIGGEKHAGICVQCFASKTLNV